MGSGSACWRGRFFVAGRNANGAPEDAAAAIMRPIHNLDAGPDDAK